MLLRNSTRFQAPIRPLDSDRLPRRYLDKCRWDMDTLEASERSALMARIRSTDTEPEIRLRKALFARGLRYRMHVRGLPGTPDIVLSRYRYAVQVRGCFWHGHENCRRARHPSSNTVFWSTKLAQNAERDKKSDAALVAMGWKVRVVWECEIATHHRLTNVVAAIEADLRVAERAPHAAPNLPLRRARIPSKAPVPGRRVDPH